MEKIYYMKLENAVENKEIKIKISSSPDLSSQTYEIFTFYIFL